MSEHDPFDGIYDDIPAQPSKPVEDEPADEPQDAPQVEQGHSVTYSVPFLRRQDKGDLQKIAGKRGLNTDGGRDALVDRILADQSK